MELSRRALLLASAGAGAAPLWKPPKGRLRALDTARLNTRVLRGSPNQRDPSDGFMYFDDGCAGLELPGTRFGIPDYVGPYLSEDGAEATFKKRTDVCVVKGGVALADVHQGLIPDCWFLSALDFSIAHPTYARQVSGGGLFEEVNQKSHACRVSLYDAGTDAWQATIVGPQLLLEGKRFPAVVSATSSDPDEFWPGIVEKALAKMCTNGGLTGYSALGGGWMSHGMTMLHGKGRSYFLPQSEVLPLLLAGEGALDGFADLLDGLLAQDCGLFVVWGKDTFAQTRRGLVPNHAYALLGLARRADGTWARLKNPWGRAMWTGGAADAVVGGGVFEMRLEDLLARFSGLDVYEPAGRTAVADAGIAVEPLDAREKAVVLPIVV